MNFWGLIKGLLIQHETDRTKQFIIEASGASSSNTKTTLRAEQTADRVIDLPDASDRLVGTATSDTLTNKFINADDNTITNIDNADIKANAAIDAAKVANGSVSNTEFQYLDGVTSAIQTQIDSKASTASLSSHIANTSTHGVSGNIVGTTDIQTLTNKTLTSPVINSPTGITKADVGLSNVDNTSDATKNSATATLTNKTISGDDNSISNLVIGSLKTVIGNANKFLSFDGTGAAQAAKDVPTGVVVGTTDTQTLTNKTLTSATLTTPSADIITLDGQASTPSNPSAGFYKTYVRDSDGKLAVLDSAGNETVVGSGNSGINYISNGQAEINTSGWVTYKDAAGVSPVDGTGGTAGTVTFTRTTSTPLRGNASFLYSSGNSAQGEGASYDFTIANEDKAKVLTIKIPYIIVTGPFLAKSATLFSDMTVWIYDVTNAALIQPSNISLFSSSSSVSDIYTAQFQTASNSNNYRLILHTSYNSLNAWSLKLDDIEITPSSYVFGTPITDEVEYTPVISGFGTVSNNVAVWSRLGDKIRVRGSFTSGTSTATPARIGLPSVVIDSVKVGVDQRKTLGIFTGAIAGSTSMASTSAGPWVITNDNDDLTSVALSLTTNTGSNHYVITNGSGILASGQTLSYEFEAPIAGWSSSVQTSDRADTRVLAFRAAGGNPASASANNPIIFPSASYDTHGGYNTSTGRYTVPVAGYYKVYGVLSSATAGAGINLFVNAVSSLNIGFTDSNGECSYIGQALLNAGDIIDIRPAATLDADASSTFIVERLTGPSAISATEIIKMSYTSSSSPSIGSASETAVAFTTAVYDSHSAYNTGTGIFTAPAVGTYHVDSATTFNSYTGSGTNYTIIYKNGVAYRKGCNIVPTVISANWGQSVSADIDCLAGDTIQIRIFQSSGSSQTLTATNSANYINISRIGL